MEEKIISTRIDKKLHEQMKIHDEINWSAVLRRAVAEKIKQSEEEHKIDREKAEKASEMIDKIRESRVFDKGMNSTELIRKWRDKRK
jgi:hypothetical protein